LEADVHGQRSRGRRRKKWIDVVKYNMEDLRLDLMDVENRAEWTGDGEPVWLTPHPRDLIQPEGERESRSKTNQRRWYGSLGSIKGRLKRM